MDPSRLIKSIFWIGSCTGIGYLLYLTITKSEEEQRNVLKNYPYPNKNPNQTYSKEEQFSSILQAAVNTDKPLYRLSKEEIDRAIRK